jgi:hypothetical protein
MSARIYVFGTSHDLQCGTGRYSADQIECFRSYIREICDNEKIALVSEEMSHAGLEHHRVTATIAARLAETLRIQHAYVDLDESERAKLNIADASLAGMVLKLSRPGNSRGIREDLSQRLCDPIRERYWVATILNTSVWPTLLICGSNHVINVASLLGGLVEQVTIVEYDFDFDAQVPRNPAVDVNRIDTTSSGGGENRGSLQQCPVCEDLVLPQVMGKHLARKHGLILQDLEARQLKVESRDYVVKANARGHSEHHAQVQESRSSRIEEETLAESTPDAAKPAPAYICPECGEPKHTYKACVHCGYSYIKSLRRQQKHVVPATEGKASASVGCSEAALVRCTNCGTQVRQDRLEEHLAKSHPALASKKSRNPAFDKPKGIARTRSSKKKAGITGECRETGKTIRVSAGMGARQCESHCNTPAKGVLRAPNRAVRAEAVAPTKGSKIRKKKGARTWITIVSGGLPGLGKRR